MAENNGNGAENSKEESIFDKYLGASEAFQSDTRRYLMEHLLDEYGSIGQAVTYNLIQNTVDNRKNGDPLRIKFEVSTKDKKMRFICSGTTGITDWERYNSLHREGTQGIARRGEGAKALIPIAASVRTETKLLDGTYAQSIWRENRIWRSDKEGEKEIFVHFPPSALDCGTTMITAEGLYDEVGDRKAGSELSNANEMVRIMIADWWLYLKDNPEVKISYEVDGVAVEVKPWEMPELEDSKTFENIDVQNHIGKTVGKIEEIFVGLSKVPLKDSPPPVIAISTGTHIVTYLSLYAGPNSSKCFGYVKASFLSSSETSNHFSFKSTSAWRLVREKLLNFVNNFMSTHFGAMESLKPQDLKAISDVTDQINKLINDQFPDWHPGGGFKPKKKKREEPKIPFIDKASTGADRYLPDSSCNISFEIVNPDASGKIWKLEARAKALSSGGKEIYHGSWKFDLASKEIKLISDMFQIADDAELGTYLVRFSLVDEVKGVLLDERRISFEVGDEEEEEEGPEPEPTTKGKDKPKDKEKRRERKGKGQFALKNALPATFPEEERVIRESYFDIKENRVILNDAAPSFDLSLSNTVTFKSHIARCTIDELARLKLIKDVNILEPDEVTREKCLNIAEEIKTTRSTFMAEWAKLLDKNMKAKAAGK